MYDADRLEDLLACDGCDLLHLLKTGAIPLPAVVLGDRLARWLPGQIAEWILNGCPQTAPPSPADYQLVRDLVWCERAGRTINKSNQRRKRMKNATASPNRPRKVNRCLRTFPPASDPPRRNRSLPSPRQSSTCRTKGGHDMATVRERFDEAVAEERRCPSRLNGSWGRVVARGSSAFRRGKGQPRKA